MSAVSIGPGRPLLHRSTWTHLAEFAAFMAVTALLAVWAVKLVHGAQQPTPPRSTAHGNILVFTDRPELSVR